MIDAFSGRRAVDAPKADAPSLSLAVLCPVVPGVRASECAERERGPSRDVPEKPSTESHSTSKRSMSSEHALVLTLVAFHFTS